MSNYLGIYGHCMLGFKSFSAEKSEKRFLRSQIYLTTLWRVWTSRLGPTGRSHKGKYIKVKVKTIWCTCSFLKATTRYFNFCSDSGWSWRRWDKVNFACRGHRETVKLLNNQFKVLRITLKYEFEVLVLYTLNSILFRGWWDKLRWDKMY